MDGAVRFSRRQFVASATMAAAAVTFPMRVRAGGPTPTTEGESVMKLTPYLLFDGTCREAMEFYHRCLGGELQLTAVKDSPAKEQMAAFQQDKVINAQLRADLLEVSASDWLMAGATPVRGNTVCMYLNGGSYDELKASFDKLAEGAEVTNPLKEVFFGVYGALNDKFGVRWMFQTDKREG